MNFGIFTEFLFWTSHSNGIPINIKNQPVVTQWRWSRSVSQWSSQKILNHCMNSANSKALLIKTVFEADARLPQLSNNNFSKHCKIFNIFRHLLEDETFLNCLRLSKFKIYYFVICMVRASRRRFWEQIVDEWQRFLSVVKKLTSLLPKLSCLQRTN